MSNKQMLNLLRKAVFSLKRTKEGYDPQGPHWKKAFEHLDALAAELSPKVPALGPVVPGGTPILQQDLTHATDGLPLYPAFDDGWQIGRPVIAPEDLIVTRKGSSQGGVAFYGTGDSGIKYWFGHVELAPEVGKRFKKGDKMALISGDHPRPHVHVGINVEALWGTGKELIHHTNYTHGAPKVGTQLAAHAAT